jgi:hypothetical protein
LKFTTSYQRALRKYLVFEEGEMMGIALSPDSHAFFDALWSIEIAQDGLSAETLLEDIIEAAENVYAGEPELEAWVAAWKASLIAIGALHNRQIGTADLLRSG